MSYWSVFYEGIKTLFVTKDLTLYKNTLVSSQRRKRLITRTIIVLQNTIGLLDWGRTTWTRNLDNPPFYFSVHSVSTLPMGPQSS